MKEKLHSFAQILLRQKTLKSIGIAAFLIGQPSTLSAQTQESINLAQQMFVSYYGRPGDPGGVNYWANQFDVSDGLDRVLSSFGNSQEYNDNFGTLNHEQLVNGLFQQMFNRDSDPAGLEFYVNRLSSGQATLASIAKQIADGTLGNDDIAFTHKVDVANSFSDLIETNNLTYNADDITAARAIISSVTFSESSKTEGVELVEQWRTGVTYYLINAMDSCESPASETYLRYEIEGTRYGWIAPGTGNWVKVPTGVSTIVVELNDNTPSETLSKAVAAGEGIGWSCNGDNYRLSDYTIVNRSDDIDGDGTGDEADAFPFDPTETLDSDQDGVGDNADAYPQDPDRTTEDPTSPNDPNDPNSYAFTVSWDSADYYSISDDERYIATENCYEIYHFDEATLTVTEDNRDVIASLEFSNGTSCDVKYLLAPSTLNADSYSVVTSRLSNNTYSTLNSGIYIETRFCVEFVDFDNATLTIDNLSDDPIGTLNFSNGASCEVRSVLLDSLSDLL